MVWQGDSEGIVDAVHDVYDALGALVDLLIDAGIPGLDDLVEDIEMEGLSEQDSTPVKVQKQQ